MKKRRKKLSISSFQHTHIFLRLSTNNLNSGSSSRSQHYTEHKVSKKKKKRMQSVKSKLPPLTATTLHIVSNHRSAHEGTVWSDSCKAESHTTYNLIWKLLCYKSQNIYVFRVKEPNISTLLMHLFLQCRKTKPLLPPKKKNHETIPSHSR